MSIDGRLGRLMPVLTARERAILILKSWKDGVQEDSAWRNSMPPSQVREFNRLIDLMNAANSHLGFYIGFLVQMAETLALREAWLVSLTLWQEHIDEIRRAIRLTVQEPVTESQYGAMVTEARKEWLPVEELAALSAGSHEGWAEADYHDDAEWGKCITDEAWERVVAEKERELRALVAEGTLRGRGRGRSLKLQMGAYDDLTGRTTGVVPEDYLTYRVLRDEQADDSALEKDRLRRLQGVLDWRPFYGNVDPELPSMPARMREGLRRGIAFQLISSWVQLRTVEMIIEEMAAEFDGIDPLKPVHRARLEETKQRLLTAQEHLRFLNLEAVLREPLPEELAELRDFVGQAS